MGFFNGHLLYNGFLKNCVGFLELSMCKLDGYINLFYK